MRPLLDSLTRQILPVFIVCTSMCQAAERPVINEMNSAVEEPLANFPEVDAASPFRSVSRRRNLAPSEGQDELVQLVEDAVGSAKRRLLSTDINTPWQMMHGLLALRREFEVRQNGGIISGLDWVSSGPMFEGESWFEKTEYGGRAHPYSRPWAFEGHANQFLAVLSMSALPLNHQFMTPTGPITISDMVEHAQKTIDSKDEPTWTLWALSRYLPPDSEWRNSQGENWSIERLVSIQTAKPLQGAACGGTHGLFALAHARNVYLRTGQPLRGIWLEAEYKIRRQISTARVQQNSNGMLSSNYFRGREYKRDFNKRMASAGHIFEFLMIALPQDELQESWVRNAIHAIAQDLLQNRKAEVRCSPLYHAVNGLNIYLDRIKIQQSTEVASGTETGAQLRPVDDKNPSTLKSIPAVRISSSKPVMTAVQAPAAGAKSEEQPHQPRNATEAIEIPAKSSVAGESKAAEKKVAETPSTNADSAAFAQSVLPAPVASGGPQKEQWIKSSKSKKPNPKTAEANQKLPEDGGTDDSLSNNKNAESTAENAGDSEAPQDSVDAENESEETTDT